MCGFLAVVGGQPPDQIEFHEALRLQEHRGPDDSGVEAVAGDVLFGFNRLSILDLSEGGRQPLTYGPIVLVFNGEIYNYLELREALENEGLSFRSSGDTEVLAAALSHWSLEETCKRARGMWAFVAYDKRDGAVLISRDRIGIKPLFFAQQGGRTILSSEIKSILKIAPEFRRPNYRIIESFIADGLLDCEDETFFEGVRPLPAGHCLRIDRDRKLSDAIPYWQLPVQEADSSIEELTEELERSVLLHLQSDVPVGLTLSGGLDSTLIACFAKDVRDLTCFSLQHPVANQEAPLIDATVKQWNLKHHYISCESAENEETISDLIYYLDQPFKASQTLYQFAIRRAVGRYGVKVLLTGDGADEVFAGYRASVAPFLVEWFARGRLLRWSREAREFQDFTGRARRALLYDSATTYLRRRFGPGSLSTKETVRTQGRLLGGGLKEHLALRILKDPMPYWLRVEDGSSMACSIETRVPFLDHKLMECAFRFPATQFMGGGRNKLMLRRVAGDRLPVHVMAQSRKFQRPGSAMRIVDVLNASMAETLGRTRPDFLPGEARKRFLLDYERKVDLHFWFRVYLTALWHERCLNSHG